MILGVVTMAKVRHPDEAATPHAAGARAAESPGAGAAELAESASGNVAAPDREDSETESLASFIAMEFVGGPPKVRQRRPGGDTSSLAPAQMIGVVATLPLG